jgi:hypothetical protein
MTSRFEAGRSGNPRGRPPGRGTAAQLRRAIESRSAELIGRLFELALDGDVQACKLLLDRCLPALRPTDPAMRFADGGDLEALKAGVSGALARGEIGPDQAIAWAAAIAALRPGGAAPGPLTVRVEYVDAVQEPPPKPPM